MDGFWEVSPVIIVFGAAVLIVKYAMDYKVKHKLIEKGLVNEKVKFLSRHVNGHNDSIKWGLVLLGAGIGLVGVEFLPFRYQTDEIRVGMVAMFAGLGLVIHYFIATLFSKDKSEHENSASI
ncbi:MAG: hypothetical protein GF404_08595 [candidate division Zixibacteria bacterium]|nr:hypothetical protein [candidate division Zixibacteria bacterium]